MVGSLGSDVYYDKLTVVDPKREARYILLGGQYDNKKTSQRISLSAYLVVKFYDTEDSGGNSPH